MRERIIVSLDEERLETGVVLMGDDDSVDCESGSGPLISEISSHDGG